MVAVARRFEALMDVVVGSLAPLNVGSMVAVSHFDVTRLFVVVDQLSLSND
jgi:hypothetical protein